MPLDSPILYSRVVGQVPRLLLREAYAEPVEAPTPYDLGTPGSLRDCASGLPREQREAWIAFLEDTPFRDPVRFAQLAFEKAREMGIDDADRGPVIRRTLNYFRDQRPRQNVIQVFKIDQLTKAEKKPSEKDRKAALKRQLHRHIHNGGKDGVHVDDLEDHVTTHGAKTVASALKELQDLIDYDAKKKRLKHKAT